MTDSPGAVLGAVAGVCFLGITFLPYAILTQSELSVYYGVGPVSPLVLAVFTVVGVIALAAVAQGRTDPAMTTGAALVVGIVVAALSLWWAIEVGGVVGGLSVSAAFENHRWVVVASALLVPIGAAIEAWKILRPQGP